MAYDKNLCPICGTNKSDFSYSDKLKRVDWRTDECECGKQNELWRKFETSKIDMKFWYINTIDFFTTATIQSVNDEVRKVAENNYYRGMDCAITHYSDDKTKANLFSAMIAKKFVEVDESVLHLSFDNLIQDFMYAKDILPTNLKTYRNAFASKKVIIISGIEDNTLFNQYAFNWVLSLITKRRDLVILSYSCPISGQSKVDPLKTIDKLQIQIPTGFETNFDSIFSDHRQKSLDVKNRRFVAE